MIAATYMLLVKLGSVRSKLRFELHFLILTRMHVMKNQMLKPLVIAMALVLVPLSISAAQATQTNQGQKVDKGDKSDKGYRYEKEDKYGRGDKGQVGPQGPQGPKGDTGATGPQGSAGSASSCTPYHWGDTGPDSGKVFYVDGSGCHGLEAQPYDVGATSENYYTGVGKSWTDALSTAAAYNTTPITGTSGLNCSTTAYPSSIAPPATPNCWHLPSKTELELFYEQKAVMGGFVSNRYWSSTKGGMNDKWNQDFTDGKQYSSHPDIWLYVRAVRAF